MTTRSLRESRHRLFFSPHLDKLPASLGLWRQADVPCNEAQELLVKALHSAIEQALTQKQRDVVELFFFEGLSQGEIARRLGVRQQVIHKRIYGVRRRGRMIGGALERLRKALHTHTSHHTL